jgi:hypothetical protein
MHRDLKERGWMGEGEGRGEVGWVNLSKVRPDITPSHPHPPPPTHPPSSPVVETLRHFTLSSVIVYSTEKPPMQTNVQRSWHTKLQGGQYKKHVEKVFGKKERKRATCLSVKLFKLIKTLVRMT